MNLMKPGEAMGGLEREWGGSAPGGGAVRLGAAFSAPGGHRL